MPRRRRTGRRTARATSKNVEWHRSLFVSTKPHMRKLAKLIAESIEVDTRSELKTGRDSPQPALSPRYRRQKASRGQSPVPNLYATGELWRSFGILKVASSWVEIGFKLFGKDEIIKWRALLKGGRNPLGFSRRDRRMATKHLKEAGLVRKRPGRPRRRAATRSAGR